MEQGQGQAVDIRFFDLGTRIGRVRYLAYGWAVSIVGLPLTFTGLYLLLNGSRLSGMVILFLAWIITTPIHFTFMIRRLHDMDRTGWWCLIYALSIPSSWIRFLDFLRHTQPSPLHLLVQLALFIFLVVLLFTPGTDGPNRFGPQPPPNSAGVVALAWSLLAFPVVAVIGVLLLASSFMANFEKLRVTQAVAAARASVYPATRYFHDNHSWPVDLASIEGTPASSLSTITYPDGGYGIVVTLKNSRGAVEVWTTDGGERWHCGSLADSAIAAQDLPEDCREEPPPSQ